MKYREMAGDSERICGSGDRLSGLRHVEKLSVKSFKIT